MKKVIQLIIENIKTFYKKRPVLAAFVSGILFGLFLSFLF